MKQKDILLLIIPGSLLITLWIIFSIYHNSVTSTIPENLTLQIVPISPTFDKTIIESLKKRTQVAPNFEFSKSSSQPAVPTPAGQSPLGGANQNSVTPSSPSSSLNNQSTQGGTLKQ